MKSLSLDLPEVRRVAQKLFALELKEGSFVYAIDLVSCDQKVQQNTEQRWEAYFFF